MHWTNLTVRPQILRDVPLLTCHLAGDPRRLESLIPPSLALHPAHRIVLNMWVLDDDATSTGFGEPGPVGISYLAAELDGEQSTVAGSDVRYPARLWLRHWCSSEVVRRYAFEASGMHLEAASISLEYHGGKAHYHLNGADGVVIDAQATIRPKKLTTQAAHSLYFGLRDTSAQAEIVRYDIPSIGDAYFVEAASVHLGSSAAAIPSDIISIGNHVPIATSFRRLTLMPYVATGVSSFNM